MAGFFSAASTCSIHMRGRHRARTSPPEHKAGEVSTLEGGRGSGGQIFLLPSFPSRLGDGEVWTGLFSTGIRTEMARR